MRASRIFRRAACLMPLSLFLSGIALAGERTGTPALFELRIGGSNRERTDFLCQLAHAYLRDGEKERAIRAYERSLAIDPKLSEARFVLSYLYIDIGKYEKSEQLIRTLLAEAPSNFRLWNNLSWLYSTSKDPAFRDGKKAVEYAQTALVFAPYDYHVWSTLAEAYYVSGEYEKAWRAVREMTWLITQYGAEDVTRESLAEYNGQVEKCRRAVKTAKSIKDSELGPPAKEQDDANSSSEELSK